MATSFIATGFGRFVAYEVALEAADAVLRLVASVKAPYNALADQARRSVTAVPLNLAEGGGRSGKARANCNRIALGEAKEALAAVRLLRAAGAVPPDGATEVLAMQDRSEALCYRVVHPA